MNGPGETIAANVTYNILWLCSTNGMNEATEGRIEISSVPNRMAVGGSSIAVGSTCASEVTQEDLMSFTTDESTETSAIVSTTSEESTPDIPCIAELSWGSWEATFYGSYNPHSDSFRSLKCGVDDFNIRSMNEWLEMGLMGHPITRLGINCPQRDDHGHEILVFEMTWEQSTLESSTSRMFAKRVIEEASSEFSEGELRELGISRNNSSDQTLKLYDSLTALFQPDIGVRRVNTARRDRRVGRTGSGDGAVFRGVSRGNLKGKARGLVRRRRVASHARSLGSPGSGRIKEAP